MFQAPDAGKTRRWIGLFLLLGIACASVTWAAGRTPTRLLRVKGWVVDSEYGKKHAGPEHAADILEAMERDYELVLWVEENEREYVILDQDAAVPYVGQYVSILGAIGDGGKLSIGTWKRVSPPETTP